MEKKAKAQASNPATVSAKDVKAARAGAKSPKASGKTQARKAPGVSARAKASVKASVKEAPQASVKAFVGTIVSRFEPKSEKAPHVLGVITKDGEKYNLKIWDRKGTAKFLSGGFAKGDGIAFGGILEQGNFKSDWKQVICQWVKGYERPKK